MLRRRQGTWFNRRSRQHRCHFERHLGVTKFVHGSNEGSLNKVRWSLICHEGNRKRGEGRDGGMLSNRATFPFFGKLEASILRQHATVVNRRRRRRGPKGGLKGIFNSFRHLCRTFTIREGPAIHCNWLYKCDDIFEAMSVGIAASQHPTKRGTRRSSGSVVQPQARITRRWFHGARTGAAIRTRGATCFGIQLCSFHVRTLCFSVSLITRHISDKPTIGHAPANGPSTSICQAVSAACVCSTSCKVIVNSTSCVRRLGLYIIGNFRRRRGWLWRVTRIIRVTLEQSCTVVANTLSFWMGGDIR
mmetsp:Transcript_5744/g.8159  ORF Transcript_5744/g.8159 Transcript_5744/m.8159 type:complete len:304 (+) Transcript_5744:735-1646(+)